MKAGIALSATVTAMTRSQSSVVAAILIPRGESPRGSRAVAYAARRKDADSRLHGHRRLWSDLTAPVIIHRIEALYASGARSRPCVGDRNRLRGGQVWPIYLRTFCPPVKRWSWRFPRRSNQAGQGRRAPGSSSDTRIGSCRIASFCSPRRAHGSRSGGAGGLVVIVMVMVMLVVMMVARRGAGGEAAASGRQAGGERCAAQPADELTPRRQRRPHAG